VAKPVGKITLGIDVAKDQLVICQWGCEKLFTLVNQPAEIQTWLETLC
jgi:hypothetical protein